jgi:hypothetical protein
MPRFLSQKSELKSDGGLIGEAMVVRTGEVESFNANQRFGRMVVIVCPDSLLQGLDVKE